MNKLCKLSLDLEKKLCKLKHVIHNETDLVFLHQFPRSLMEVVKTISPGMQLKIVKLSMQKANVRNFCIEKGFKY